MQRRAQKRLVDARNAFWLNRNRETGKCERFVTLTAPTLQGISLSDSEKIFNHAFKLLSDRVFWVKRVDAGAKHLEFTVNSLGYHTHIHLLIYGRYMERDADQEMKSKEYRVQRAAKLAKHKLSLVKDDLPPLGNLQDEWTSCITEAARECCGRVIEWNAPETESGWYSQFPFMSGEVVEVQPTTAKKANVDVRAVREKGCPSQSEIGLPSAVKELTKYVTKASSWSDVPSQQLVEIAEVRRWSRCFELLKQWRRDNKKAVPDVEPPQVVPDVEPPRVELSIEPGELWEDFCKRVAREKADPKSYSIAWNVLIAAGAMYVAPKGYIASLDTDFVFRSCSEDETESPPGETVVRARSPSLMALGEVMEFGEWLKMVAIRLANTRQKRTRLLAKKYPYARFYCLDGSKFSGLEIQQEHRQSRIEAICRTFEAAA